MDEKNKEEITEILSKIENLRAAQTISQNYSATFDYLVKKYFNPKMEEFAKQRGLEYHYEKSEELYVKFHFTNPIWQGKCWIGFTFESRSCMYGIVNNFANGYRVSDENRKNIHEQLNRLNVSGKQSDWWPFYAYYTNLTLDAWENEIINSEIFLNDCKERIEKLLTAMVGIPI